jgi:hypothetical protein
LHEETVMKQMPRGRVRRWVSMGLAFMALSTAVGAAVIALKADMLCFASESPQAHRSSPGTPRSVP